MLEAPRFGTDKTTTADNCTLEETYSIEECDVVDTDCIIVTHCILENFNASKMFIISPFFLGDEWGNEWQSWNNSCRLQSDSCSKLWSVSSSVKCRDLGRRGPLSRRTCQLLRPWEWTHERLADVFDGEETMWANWTVAVEAYCSVVDPRMGEMMSTAETSTVPQYVAVRTDSEKQQSNQLYYMLCCCADNSR